MEYYSQYLKLYKRFIDDILTHDDTSGVDLNFLTLSTAKLIESNLLIVLAKIVSFSFGFVFL